MGYADFFLLLGKHRHRLTRQELKTLRGQAMAGEYDAAKRGLAKIIMRKDAACGKDAYAEQTKPTV